jgi:hypothetical protein
MVVDWSPWFILGKPKKKMHHNNFLNALLMVAVGLPSIWFYWFVTRQCSHINAGTECACFFFLLVLRCVSLSPLNFSLRIGMNKEGICALVLGHPLWTINVVFFLNVCVLFWLLALLQDSTWV